MRLPRLIVPVLALLLAPIAASAADPEAAERAPLTAEQVDVLHAAQQDRTPTERLATFHAERAIELRKLTATADPSDRETLHRRIAAFKRQTTVLFLELQLAALEERGATPALRASLEERLEHARAALDAVRGHLAPTVEVDP